MNEHNEKSVCQFPLEESPREGTLDIVNFVYEPHPLKCDKFEVRNYYMLYLAISGSCDFCTDYKRFAVKKGDIFFVFPNKRYKYEKENKIKFIYISFTNIEAKQLLNKLNVNYVSPVCQNHLELISLFKKEFENSKQNSTADLTAKGLLYLTFGRLCQKRTNDSLKSKKIETVKQIVAYIEENIGDADLTLKKISAVCFYHFNYVSQIFKEIMGVSFIKYLTSQRIKKAQMLLETTSLSVAQISFAVGFKDSGYFEKVFKKTKRLTPTKYRELYSKT